MFNEYLFNETLFNRESPPSQSHYIFSGSYHAASPSVNHVLVIGKDISDNPVYGESYTGAELTLLGERPEYKFAPEARTEAEADNVAAALLVRQRLNSKQGYIILPPHCGVQLFDVIRIRDEMSGVLDVDFRVSGIELVFDALGATFCQKLFLSAI